MRCRLLRLLSLRFTAHALDEIMATTRGLKRKEFSQVSGKLILIVKYHCDIIIGSSFDPLVFHNIRELQAAARSERLILTLPLHNVGLVVFSKAKFKIFSEILRVCSESSR